MWKGCLFYFICVSDHEMQSLKDILTTANVQSIKEQPSTSTSWCLHQSAAQDEWRKARSYHLDCLRSCNEVPERKCCHCSSPAIIRCRDCMPKEWLCMECDIHIHTKLTLHNRESCIKGIYKPIEPTVRCVEKDGTYFLVNQGILLIFFGKVVKSYVRPLVWIIISIGHLFKASP